MIQFLKGMLSDGGDPSTSRGLSWAFGIVGCVCLIRLVWLIPKESISLVGVATFLAGLTGFVSAPYAINRFSQPRDDSHRDGH